MHGFFNVEEYDVRVVCDEAERSATMTKELFIETLEDAQRMTQNLVSISLLLFESMDNSAYGDCTAYVGTAYIIYDQICSLAKSLDTLDGFIVAIATEKL